MLFSFFTARPAFYKYTAVMFSLNAVSLFACGLTGNGAGFGYWYKIGLLELKISMLTYILCYILRWSFVFLIFITGYMVPPLSVTMRFIFLLYT